MCTVTYIPAPSGFYLTSSRDESTGRPTLFPQEYLSGKQKLVYPKDEMKGGSWMAVSSNRRAACLLNGAFERHERKENYSKSRGLILIESFSYKEIQDFIMSVPLEGVEPFTLLLLEYPKEIITSFNELRWDGKKKHSKLLDPNTPQIWSSVTLYEREVIQWRKKLFESWIKKNPSIEDRWMMDFHATKYGIPQSEDILMKRDDSLMTLSISQIHVSKEATRFNYSDLITQKYHSLLLK